MSSNSTEVRQIYWHSHEPYIKDHHHHHHYYHRHKFMTDRCIDLWQLFLTITFLSFLLPTQWLTANGQHDILVSCCFSPRAVPRGGSREAAAPSEISDPCGPQKVQDKAATCQNYITCPVVQCESISCVPPDESVATPVAPKNENPRTATGPMRRNAVLE